jgi:hypothetical protein
VAKPRRVDLSETLGFKGGALPSALETDDNAELRTRGYAFAPKP